MAESDITYGESMKGEVIKDAFIKNMSFGIRTPLNTLVGFSELLVSSTSLEESRLFRRFIYNNSRLLLHQVNDIFYLSAIDADMIVFDPERISLMPFLRDECKACLENADIFCQESAPKCTIQVKAGKDDEHLVVYTDKHPLGVIVRHLLYNALKFTHKGTIRLSCKKDGDFFLLSVEDTGVGIPAEKQEVVFDRFVKLDEESRGIGLGLAVVRDLVTEMGGEVSLSSKPRVGTTVEVRLPVYLKKRGVETSEQQSNMQAFMSDMSFAIRTPLNAIIGFCELMGSIGNETDRRHVHDIIKKNCDELFRFISDVLALNNMNAQLINIKVEKVDFSVFFDQVYKELYSYAADNVVTFVKENPYETLVVNIDRERVRQVIRQFADNAFKFTDAGRITLSYTYSDGRLCISCQDTGCGIDPARHRDVFRRFYKVNPHTEGTGLGLYVCHMIAQRLGGKILLESTPHVGSKFVFSLPCEPERIKQNDDLKKITITDLYKRRRMDGRACHLLLEKTDIKTLSDFILYEGNFSDIPGMTSRTRKLLTELRVSLRKEYGMNI